MEEIEEANKYIEKLNDINSVKYCAPKDPNDIVAGIPIKAAQQLGPTAPSDFGILKTYNTFLDYFKTPAIVTATQIPVNVANQLNGKKHVSTKVYYDVWFIWVVLFAVLNSVFAKNQSVVIASNVILGWFFILLLYPLLIYKKEWRKSLIWDICNNLKTLLPQTTNVSP